MEQTESLEIQKKKKRHNSMEHKWSKFTKSHEKKEQRSSTEHTRYKFKRNQENNRRA